MIFSAPQWGLAALALLALAAWRARDRRAWFDAVGAALLLAALAQPQWRTHPAARDAQSPALVLLDVSRSMLAKDIAPSRFEHAVAQIADRVRAEPGRSFGLIAFAGAAWRVAPPTADHEALFELLGELDPRRVSTAGSDVAAALAVALELLESLEPATHESAIPGPQLLLYTDGEWDGAATEPLQQRAAQAGIELVAHAVGTTLATAIEDGAEASPDRTAARPERVAELASAFTAPVAEPSRRRPIGIVTWCAVAAYVCLLIAHVLAGAER
ncbi:MAG: VWA domain-containing protein [Planctomycetes bacterium]|nr:VWA domain-containing protein [Planctomycetota bacterium]